MIHILPLDSYPQLCQYVALFEENSDSMTDYRVYKRFLEKYTDTTFITYQPGLNLQTESIVINQSPPLSLLGFVLESTESDSREYKYLVPDDINLLSLTSFLRSKESYLYQSAYHYWCHEEFFQNYQNGETFIFLNFDNWAAKTLVPFNLQQSSVNGRKIPILKPDRKISMPESLDLKNCHDEIYNSLSKYIFDKHFPLQSTNPYAISHLSNHLKRINILQLIETEKSDLEFIIEISPSKTERYYKVVQLDLQIIASIALQKLPLDLIYHWTEQHPQITFIILSQYGIISNFQKGISKSPCLNSTPESFSRIWQAKQVEKFPLFGIELDQVNFGIGGQGNQIQWISLNPNKDIVSFEGEPQEIIGQISELNQDRFKIKSDIKGNQVQLPIQVNGNEYEKAFEIIIHGFDHQEDVWVQIVFTLIPGRMPVLKVKDIQNRYFITNQLTVPQNQSVSQYKSSYIPISSIIKSRKMKRIVQIEYLRFNLHTIRQQVQSLKKLIDNCNNLANFSNWDNLDKCITKLKDEFRDRLSYIIPNDSSSEGNRDIQQLQELLNTLDFNGILKKIFLNSKNRSKNSNLYRNVFVLIGKLYHFAEFINVVNCFDREICISFSQQKDVGLKREFFYCLARLAYNNSIQRLYFSLFNDCLLLPEYLWGYGRILKWYYSYSDLSGLNYHDHFNKILLKLLSDREQIDYQLLQSVFVCLIYLLTFRELDTTFCMKESTEFNLSKQVISTYQSHSIILNAVSRDKSLNQMFENMIEGTASEQEIQNLLQAE